MNHLTRRDVLSVLEKAGTPEDTIIRIKAHWAQLGWQVSAQDVYDMLMELELQQQKDKRTVIEEVNAKLRALIGELE